MEFTEHPGRHVADIELFALSTCPHCRHTKEFFNANDIEYKFVDVDLLPDDELEEAEAMVLSYNPNDTFPTIVVNDGEEVIVGFQEDKLEELIAS